MSPTEIFQSARALAPQIKARAEEIASLRKLPADLAATLKASHLFAIAAPRAWGGAEMTPREQCELLEILACADASVSWCVKIGCDWPYFVTGMNESAARELFTSSKFAGAGQVPPNGRAERVPGGYRVSGRWRFASGCTHADVIDGGCLVTENGQPVRSGSGPEAPETRLIFAPASKFQIHDTWYSMGLAGSGSNDVSCEDLFVPEEHTWVFGSPSQRAEPLYRYSGAVYYGLAGVALGLARNAIETGMSIAENNVIRMPPPPKAIKSLPTVRLAIAKAETRLGAARAYSYESHDALWSDLQRTGEVTPHSRRALILSTIHAFRSAREIAESIFDTFGTTALYAKCPLERIYRDAITVNQHVLLNDMQVETVGAAMFGEAPPTNRML